MRTPDLFFVDRVHDYTEARRICALYPVVDECLEEAVAQNLNNGILAGMTAKNRRQVAKGEAEPLRATCERCGELFVTTKRPGGLLRAVPSYDGRPT